MKYNKALDFSALALQAASKGKNVLAAKLFAQAVAAPDAQDALRIIEASNGKAFEEAQAKRLAASSEDCDEDDVELGADLVEDGDGDVDTDEPMDNDEDALEEELPQEELAGDLDELEDEVDTDDDGDDDGMDETEAFAAVLASMKKRAAK